MPGIEFPWEQITVLDLSYMDIRDEERCRVCVRFIVRCLYLEILITPLWDWKDDDEAKPTTCSNVLELHAMRVPNALTFPLLQEASLRDNSDNYGSLHSFKHLLVRSNCMNTLTSLSLDSVQLAASPDSTLHSILLQTHDLTYLKLIVDIQHYSAQTVGHVDIQIGRLVKSLEVIPTKAVTFLPLLSSLDIRIDNHRNSCWLPYVGPIGEFASAVKARWKGDDTIGPARLWTCHFIVHAHCFDDFIFREAGGGVVYRVFDAAERVIFNALVDNGMDLAIQVLSEAIQVCGPYPGSNYAVFATNGSIARLSEEGKS
ncbi:hypothetical protein CPB85DRAFT_260068 [Mucidula mucida]|nr:hypothetical protein CPB85DRAFT_260068 [Mucidula mucida]